MSPAPALHASLHASLLAPLQASTPSTLHEHAGTQWVLVALIVSVGVLGVIALLFAAAVLVLRVHNERTRERWIELEARWTTDLLDLVTGVPEAAAALREKVAPGEERSFLDFLIRFGRRLSGGERALLAALAKPLLHHLVPDLASRSPESRARAVQTLAIFGLPEHEAEVVGALRDPSPIVALTAAWALARREHDRYADDIVAQLERFESWSTDFVASMLARIGPAVAAPLRRIFGDPAARARSRVVAGQALRHLNDLPAAEIAAGILGAERDREVLAAALRVLEHIGRPAHAPAVRALVQASDDPVVHKNAIEVLSRLGGDDEDVEAARRALSDPSPWVAMAAARALEYLGRRDILADVATTAEHPRAVLAQQVLAESGA